MIELVVRVEGVQHKLQFEHSLVALSKWESKVKRPFLGSRTPDVEEMIFYYQCMLLSPEVDPDLVYALSPDQMDELTTYMGDPMTAAKAPDQKPQRSTEVVTSDLIYFWMTAMKINWEAQYWHLNRLMMLVTITNHKNQPEDKRKKSVDLNSWREANERQKALFKTKG